MHRPKNVSIPYIKTKWVGQKEPSYTLKNSHLEEYPVFKTFNEKFFNLHLLPSKKITYRYNSKKTVLGEELKKIVNKLIDEILDGKKKYADFIVLRERDFNQKKKSGLIILKCKHHPFVVKIFMENPRSFVQHKSKGFVPFFFFYMAGGINRHLLGFTRIKNLENMQKLLNQSQRWSKIVTMPRKWFFLPKKNRWIEISGKNIGKKKEQKIKVPGTYCVVSDWVDAERRSSVFKRDDRRTCMELCNYLELAIDPHIDNFLIERKTKKIAIVDTEHFLSVVGMKKKRKFTGYFSWGIYLAKSCAKAMFFRSKADRKFAQTSKSETELKYK